MVIRAEREYLTTSGMSGELTDIRDEQVVTPGKNIAELNTRELFQLTTSHQKVDQKEHPPLLTCSSLTDLRSAGGASTVHTLQIITWTILLQSRAQGAPREDQRTKSHQVYRGDELCIRSQAKHILESQSRRASNASIILIPVAILSWPGMLA